MVKMKALEPVQHLMEMCVMEGKSVRGCEGRVFSMKREMGLCTDLKTCEAC